MIAPALYGAYAMSKHALEAFCDSMRAELLPGGVAVSLVQAGSAHTAIEGKMAEQLAAYAGTPYAGRVRSMQQHIDASLRWGMLPGPSLCCSAVRHAVEARQPQARYLAGADAWAVWAVLRFVPSPIVDLVQRLIT